MIGRLREMRRLRRDERGATLMEFGFVAPVMMLMLMAGFESGYTIYLKTVAAGTLERQARAASLEGATESQFDAGVRRAIMLVMPRSARDPNNITLVKRNYTDYSRIDAAEKITTDWNENGELDPPDDWDSNGTIDGGDCWLDEDMNGEYGTNEGANGLGGPDDGVFYSVNISFPRMFPMVEMLGMSENVSVTVRTLVINQPYGTQTVRPTVCLTS